MANITSPVLFCKNTFRFFKFFLSHSIGKKLHFCLVSWHRAHRWIRSRKQKHSTNLSRLIPFSIPMRGEQRGENVWMELNGGENHLCAQPGSDISLPPIPAPEKSITSKKFFFFFFWESTSCVGNKRGGE